MDLLSHGLVGAAAALAVAQPKEARAAAGAAFGAALLPDVDAFFRSSADPLMVLDWHRHFTHALIFVPIGALLAALLLWPLLRHHLSFSRLYGFALLGYALAPLLDACTSYGTHLLWPFSSERTAFSIIAVVDPLFTLLLAVPAAFAFLRRKPVAARVALTLGLAYLGIGALQHQRALGTAEGLATERGLEPERIQVRPTMGNLLLWRSMMIAEGRVRVDAVRVGILAETRVYAGESGPVVDPARVASAPTGSTARADLERFAYFTDGWLALHPRDPERIGDARYSMLPNSLEPIWSVRMDAQRPEGHVELLVERRMTPELRRCFIDMLVGRPTGCGVLESARSTPAGVSNQLFASSSHQPSKASTSARPARFIGR